MGALPGCSMDLASPGTISGAGVSNSARWLLLAGHGGSPIDTHDTTSRGKGAFIEREEEPVVADEPCLTYNAWRGYDLNLGCSR